MSAKSKTLQSLNFSVAIIVLLSLCLAITTAALAYSMVKVENNFFGTATVGVNLNDGVPVISEEEFIFEPGMTVKKDFFIENIGTSDVFYRFYFANIEGELRDVLEVKVCDGNKVLCEGTTAELTRDNAKAVADILGADERKELQIYFRLPASEGNEAQEQYLLFDFGADAVQVRNNTDKEFE